MSVFLIFASKAADLCRAGDWSLDCVDQESREFLRRLTLTWRYEEGRDRAGNQIREAHGNWAGELMRWIEEKFEALPEWTTYEDMRLSAIERAVRSSPASQPDATSTPPNQTISPGFAPSRRGFGEVPPSAGTEQSITSFAIPSGQVMGNVAVFTDPKFPPPDIWQEALPLIEEALRVWGFKGSEPANVFWNRWLAQCNWHGETTFLNASIKHCRVFAGHLLGEGRDEDAAVFARVALGLEKLKDRADNREKDLIARQIPAVPDDVDAPGAAPTDPPTIASPSPIEPSRETGPLITPRPLSTRRAHRNLLHKGDSTLLRDPHGMLKESVSFKRASTYLGVSLRQVQRLVSGKRSLTTVGGGNNRQITVGSLLEYLPEKKATQSDPLRHEAT
jgi:hypothetical protein